jgi:hypothetical protein
MSAAENYQCESCGKTTESDSGAPVCCGLPMIPYDLLYTMENPERTTEIGADFVCGVCGKRLTVEASGVKAPYCCGQPMENT